MVRVSIYALAAMLCFALTSAPAFAQDGVSSELERTATSTPKEKIKYTQESTDEMRAAVRTVTKLLETARREQDVVKIQCLNNRLTSLRALLQVSEAAQGMLQDALASGAEERADHEFRKVAVAREKSRQILAEAERCAGDSGVADGSTKTTVTSQPSFFDDPTGENNDDDDDIDEDIEEGLDDDPPESSPFN